MAQASAPQNAPAAAPGTPAAAPAKSYHVELNFSGSDISLKELDLTDLPAPQRVVVPALGWRCDVVAPGNLIEDSFLFAIPTTTCSDVPGKDSGLTGGCVSKDKASFSIEVPYYENGIGINFTRLDGKSYYINTLGFAKLCGDNICESNEDYSTCSKDCRSGVRDGYCDGIADGTCDPDCFSTPDQGASDPDCKAAPAAVGTDIAWWIVGGLAIILVIGIFAVRKRK